MYAHMRPETDARGLTCGYVEPVETTNTPFTRVFRWFRDLNPWVLDTFLGTVFTVLGIVGLFAANNPKYHYRDPDAIAVLLSLAATLPFYVRRRLPFASMLVAIVATVTLLTRDYQSNLQSQILLIAAYTIGSYCTTTKRWLGLVAFALGLVAVAGFGIPDTTGANIVLTGALYFSAYALGTSTRNRRMYEQQLEQRATDLERERDEEAKRAVADERLRIAQELHDVVAHSMGVIAVQAGVGAHVIDKNPAEAKKSLQAIAATSRSTLTEIRRLLGVLRADENGAYQPAPGLTDLGRLVDDLGGAGLPVTLKIDGDRDDVPPGVDLTAYRIVQEALTNVLKHAGPAHATVAIDYRPSSIHLVIGDDGRGVNGRASDGGHGLIGMRERVGVYGGTLSAGPAPGGGFRVDAELPYGDEE
jgi:signal transduction histidine kinase